MSNFTVYSRQHPRITGNWQAPYEPHSFALLEEAEAYLSDPDLDYSMYIGIHCNFNPGNGMDAGLIRNDEGKLELILSDGGDGGSSAVVPLLRFLAKTLPDLYRQAMSE